MRGEETNNANKLQCKIHFPICYFHTRNLRNGHGLQRDPVVICLCDGLRCSVNKHGVLSIIGNGGKNNV